MSRWIKQGITGPFGSIKQSDTGRKETINEMIDFVQVKNVNVQL